MVPEPLDDVIARCLDGNPSDPDAADVLRLYLELPRVVLAPNADDPTLAPMKRRSSFEAGYSDARYAAESGIVWLAAVGHLAFLDQVGTALRRTDVVASGPSSVECALELFGTVDARTGAAIYALRCALAHDYSLVNMAEKVSNPSRREALRHAFVLRGHGGLSVVEFPSEPWDGDPQHVAQTFVDLRLLALLVADVRDQILQLQQQGLLQLAIDPAEARRRYFFVHPVDVWEWDQQQRTDERGADAAGPAQDLDGRTTVFLTGRPTPGFQVVLASLEAAGFQVQSWDDLGGAPLHTAIRDVLRDVGAVVAVLDEQVPAAVLQEVGTAVGLGKPVVLAVEGSDAGRALPVALQQLQAVAVDGDAVTAESLMPRLVAALDLAAGELSNPVPMPLRRDDAPGSAMELQVKQLLEFFGERVVEQPSDGDGWIPDFAVWVPELLPYLNPVIVEVKAPSRDTGPAAGQVFEYLTARDLLLGLLVVEGEQPWQWQTNARGAVAVVGLRALAGMSRHEFRDQLTNGRNRIVHA